MLIQYGLRLDCSCDSHILIVLMLVVEQAISVSELKEIIVLTGKLRLTGQMLPEQAAPASHSDLI